MRVAVVQFAPAFPGHDENWARIRAWAEALDADIVVFPELAACGYGYRSRAEIRGRTDPRAALAPLEAIARRHRRLLVGGFAEEDGGRLYNSAFAVGPEGTEVYRKLHLWNWETAVFDPGAAPGLVRFAGHRFALEICYDLQFPELAAYYSHRGAEALLVPMAWAEEPTGPIAGLQPYSHLAIGTAFAHGLFVVVANRTGVERGARFPGESGVADPLGRFAHLGDAEGVWSGEIDFGAVDAAKHPTERNHVDADARLAIRFDGA